jgi:hypothetical protein
MDPRAIPPKAPTSTTPEHAVALAIVGLVAGVAIGASGPLLFVVVSPFFGAGPTWGGLALLLGTCVAVVTVIPALLVRSGRWWVVPLFAASATLSLGVLAGNRVGPALGVGDWPTPRPLRSPESFAPAPVILDAPGTVAVRFDGVSGFTATRPEPQEGGLFGHWCFSKPDSKAVGSVHVLEVGSLNGEPFGASLTLHGKSLPPVWIVFQMRRAHTGYALRTGEGQLVANDASAGRVKFDNLVSDDPSPTGYWPATLSGVIAWQCSAWRQR